MVFLLFSTCLHHKPELFEVEVGVQPPPLMIILDK